MKRAAALLLILYAAAASMIYAASVEVGIEGGRTYVLHTPPGNQGDSVPLVLVLHGSGGSAWQMHDSTRFNDIADTLGWAVAFPEGIGDDTGHYWHTFLLNGRSQADDIEYLQAVIEDIQTRCKVGSIYMTGFSAGAILVYQFWSEHPDLVHGIAPVAGCIGGIDEYGKPVHIRRPDSPVPVLIIHGWKDTMIPFHGGLGRHGLGPWECLSVADAVEFFVDLNGSARAPVETVEVGPSGAVIVDQFLALPPAAPVTVRTYTDLAHNWPREAAEVIMAFFAQQEAEIELPRQGRYPRQEVNDDR